MEDVSQGRLLASLRVEDKHMAPNGFMHGGAMVTFADTAAGFACFAHIDEGQNFTTVELKTNFLRTSRPEHTLNCEALLQHAGRKLQIWDATITDAHTGQKLSIFRCSQLILEQT